MGLLTPSQPSPFHQELGLAELQTLTTGTVYGEPSRVLDTEQLEIVIRDIDILFLVQLRSGEACSVVNCEGGTNHGVNLANNRFILDVICFRYECAC